ncbi:MAG TPA: hypothetical protein PLK30_23040 [Blastocatellia bacterium]|nr:hypothetical protein [Blastocatellia bacterium]
MANTNTLFIDDRRRVEQYETVKESARSEIEAQVTQQADDLTIAERNEAAALGKELKQKALSEVRETGQELERVRMVARVSQFVDYVFYLIYGLISLQIVFDLFGARRGNGIRDFIEFVSAPILAPFKNLFLDPAAGVFRLRFSYLAALVIYILLHIAINGLLRMLALRKAAI